MSNLPKQHTNITGERVMNKIYAEILVKCGMDAPQYYRGVLRNKDTSVFNPLSDTLEGRRQADAIEDWLSHKYPFLWAKESTKRVPKAYKEHEWRLDRIKWCVKQLVEKEL